MKNRKFYNWHKITDVEKFNPRKIDIIAGIVIIVPFSFFLCAFFYLIREDIRLLTVKENFDMLVLSDAEMNFYNFSYALIAVIAGFSIALSIMFDRPRKRGVKRNFRRNMILNDQRVLLIFFLGSYFKLAFLYGLLIVFGNVTHLYLFSFYPQYKFVFIFIPITLFLNQWIHIRRVFRNKSIKYFLLSAAIIFLLSFGMSRINFIDYKSLNKISLSKNAQYGYGMQLPEINNPTHNFSRYTINFYLVYDVDSTPIILYNGERINLTDINKILEAKCSSFEEYELPYIRPRLNVDKNIRMETLSEVFQELSVKWHRIHLGVLPKEREYDPGYYFYQSLPLVISSWDPYVYQDSESNLKEEFSNNHLIRVEQTKYGDCLINGQYVMNENLFDTLIFQIDDNSPNYIVVFDANNDASVNNFVFVYSTIHSIPQILRENMAFDQYGLSYESLTNKKQEEYNRSIPMRIMMLTDANRDIIEQILNKEHNESK